MGGTDCSSNVLCLINMHKNNLLNKHVGPILNANGIVIEEEKTKRETIREQCKEMYQKITVDECKLLAFLKSIKLSEVGLNSVGGEITVHEVREAISHLSKGKAPGPDGLPSELFLTCKEDLVELLTAAYNDGFKSGRMHSSFYHGVISLIYKKGPSNNLDKIQMQF